MASKAEEQFRPRVMARILYTAALRYLTLQVLVAERHVQLRLIDCPSQEYLAISRKPTDSIVQIEVTPVVNLTSDLIPRSTKMMMARQVEEAVSAEALQRTNIAFIRTVDTRPSTAPSPTHRLGSTFRSVTRIGPGWREELYQCEYELISLSDGQIVWADQFELPRWAEGEVTR